MELENKNSEKTIFKTRSPPYEKYHKKDNLSLNE